MPSIRHPRSYTTRCLVGPLRGVLPPRRNPIRLTPIRADNRPKSNKRQANSASPDEKGRLDVTRLPSVIAPSGLSLNFFGGELYSFLSYLLKIRMGVRLSSFNATIIARRVVTPCLINYHDIPESGNRHWRARMPNWRYLNKGPYLVWIQPKTDGGFHLPDLRTPMESPDC